MFLFFPSGACLWRLDYTDGSCQPEEKPRPVVNSTYLIVARARQSGEREQ